MYCVYSAVISSLCSIFSHFYVQVIYILLIKKITSLIYGKLRPLKWYTSEKHYDIPACGHSFESNVCITPAHRQLHQLLYKLAWILAIFCNCMYLVDQHVLQVDMLLLL